MFNYQEFVSRVKTDGLARQNRFFIQIAMPSLSGDSAELFSPSGENSRMLHAFCKSVSLQGVNVATIPHRDVGETFEVPYDRNFTPASFTFYMDRNMYIRKFFDDWVNAIQDPYSRQLGYYKDIVSPAISIFVLDKMDLVNYMVILKDAFPKTIGALNLDQSNNEIMTFDVTIDYHNYNTIIVPQSHSSLNSGYDSALGTTPGGAPAPTRIGRIQYGPLLGNNPIQSLYGPEAAIALQRTLKTYYGGVLDAVNGFKNDFLGFQRQIGQGLGVLNAVGADIRTIINSPRDILNSAKGTLRDLKSGLRNFKNSVRIL